MQCPDCGAHYSAEDQFCGECGRSLSPETPPIEPVTSLPMKEPATATQKPARRAPAPLPAKPKPKWAFPRLPLALGVAIFLLLCLGVIGTGLLFSIVGESTVGPTRSAPVQGELLHLEDFRDPGSGWDTWDEGYIAGKYVDGAYRLAVTRENYMAYSYPVDGEKFKDAVIEVDARQIEGSLNSTFGLIVRHQVDEDQYYWFQISGDGYYSVEKKWQGEWILLQAWEETGAIKQGLDTTNQIRVVCYGDRFSFYVNGTHLTDLTDDSMRSGIPGVAAGAYAEPPVLVDFDNLRVYALED